MILFFLFLTYFTLCKTGSRFICLPRIFSNLFLFMAESYSTVCVSVCVCVCVYVCHNFLFHSSIYGHLGCFHVLPIVNAAMNTGVHVLIMVFSGHMPSGGISGSYGRFIPSFSISLHMFSMMSVSVYIPTNSAIQCSMMPVTIYILSTSSPAFIICRYFWLWPFWLVWGRGIFLQWQSSWGAVHSHLWSRLIPLKSSSYRCCVPSAILHHIVSRGTFLKGSHPLTLPWWEEHWPHHLQACPGLNHYYIYLLLSPLMVEQQQRPKMDVWMEGWMDG